MKERDIVPQIRVNGHLKKVSRVLAEKALGRKLKQGEEVHHSDVNTANNLNTNLVICPSAAYHMLIHVRTRAYDDCGNANHRKCQYCQVYDSLENMDFTAAAVLGRYNHRSCRNKYRNAFRTERIALLKQNRISWESKQAHVTK